MADPRGIRDSGKDIYSVNFADYLPDTLKRDAKMKALAAAVTEQMLGVSKNIDNVLIYSRINELPEELIDILAFDMHVDWYDYAYPLEMKRNILKNSVKVHKRMGTKYAVETALRDVHKNAVVYEWFEYGGRPYHFKIDIDIGWSGLTEGTDRAITQNIQFYKNLRSHCDGIYYKLSAEKTKVKAAAQQKIGPRIKVKPFLKKDIKVKAGKMVTCCLKSLNLLKIKPLLVYSIETGTEKEVKAVEAVFVTLKAKPLLRKDIRVKTRKTVKFRVKSLNVLKIQPLLSKEIKGRTGKVVTYHLKARNTLRIKAGLPKKLRSGTRNLKKWKSYLRSQSTVEIRKEKQ